MTAGSSLNPFRLQAAQLGKGAAAGSDTAGAGRSGNDKRGPRIEQLDSVGIACMAKQHAIEAPVGANNKEDDS